MQLERFDRRTDDMAIAIGTALTVASIGASLLPAVFGFLKSGKNKKQAKQLALMNQQQQMQMQAQLQAFQSGNMYAMSGIDQGFMQPSGMQPGQRGPAPQGFYPQAFA
jgi:hypothetical protein